MKGLYCHHVDLNRHTIFLFSQDSNDGHDDGRTEHYEGSQESVQDWGHPPVEFPAV